MQTRQLTLLSMLTALSIGIQLTPRPPNVEFTSFISFTAGVILGSGAGGFVGALTMLINGFLSPWGQAGMNMPFQVVGMALAGFLGGVYKMLSPSRLGSKGFCLETAIMGALVALIYDLITNVGFGLQLVFSGMDPALALLLPIAYGSFFSLIHIASNVVVFGALHLPFADALNHLNVEGLSWLKRERLHS